MAIFFNKNEKNPIITPTYTTEQVGWISNNGMPTQAIVKDGNFNSKVSGSEISEDKIQENVVYNIFQIETSKVEVVRNTDGEWGVFKMPKRG